VLRGSRLAIPPNGRLLLMADDGRTFLTAPVRDPHRHYLLSVVMPGVTILHGVGPLHQHDGPPQEDKPIDWLRDPVCCYTVKTTDQATGQTLVFGYVENTGSQVYPGPGSFELKLVKH